MLTLRPDGSVEPWQQARLGWFLVSAHGGLARLALLQAALAPGAGGVVLQAAAAQSAGIVTTLLRATAWQPDLWAAQHLPQWEMAWLPRPPAAAGLPATTGLVLDAAALGLAVASVVRPAPLLPAAADQAHPFAVALALAELESGRLLQPFLRLLKASVPAVPRAAVEELAEARRLAVAALWNDLVGSLSPV